jgi:glycosyltransferase involved in cell wall biosynthesis
VLDVVVHASSTPEPFGLTVIEGMAAGKPVVATAAGGVLDWGWQHAVALLKNLPYNNK